jgi:hypothetical protein
MLQITATEATLLDPVVQEIEGFFVVRDDLIPGGSKRRALRRMLQAGHEYVYGGPAFGYAQMSLAYAAKDVGAAATIFVAKRKDLHHRTKEAVKAGAKLVQVPHGYLSNVRAKARAYCCVTGAIEIPFGCDCPSFLEAMSQVALSTKIFPKEVWSVSGSGALTRALQIAWPDAKFYAVQIGKPPRAGKATIVKAPEAYEQDARKPPPFPSCSNYDAKAWQFIKDKAAKGALFWNVGK